MNLANATLAAVGTGLIALGATALNIAFSWGAVIEILLGLLVFLAYELTPSKVS